MSEIDNFKAHFSQADLDFMNAALSPLPEKTTGAAVAVAPRPLNPDLFIPHDIRKAEGQKKSQAKLLAATGIIFAVVATSVIGYIHVRNHHKDKGA